MKKQFVFLRNIFIKLKIYLSRTRGYLGIINAGMILFLFLSNLEDYNIDIRIQDWIIPIFVLGFLGMFLFGYIEDKLGFYKQEQRVTQSRNPYMREILDRLDSIEKKLDQKSHKKK